MQTLGIVLMRNEQSEVQDALEGLQIAALCDYRGTHSFRAGAAPPLLVPQPLASSATNVPLSLLAADLEEDEAYSVCNGGALQTETKDHGGPVLMDADELTLSFGEAALVPAVAAVQDVADSKLDIYTNTACPVSTFGALWGDHQGFVVVANFSQPDVVLELMMTMR